MQRNVCILFVLATPMLCGAENKDAVSKELGSLQGTWKTVAMEAGGKELPKEGVLDFKVLIGTDGKSTGKMPQEEFRFTTTVNPNKSPKTIDIRHDSGTEKGKTQYGIYKLDGDKFTVCVTPPGSAEDNRPKDFSTKDTANVVFVFERVKEDKKP